MHIEVSTSQCVISKIHIIHILDKMLNGYRQIQFILKLFTIMKKINKTPIIDVIT
jgi:hypothetical protein